MFESTLNHRRFLKVLGTAAAAASVSPQAFNESAPAVSILIDPADQVAASTPVKWALELLSQALITRGIAINRSAKPLDDHKEQLRIFAAGAQSAPARQLLKTAGVSVIAAPEALGLVSVHHHGGRALLACGYDSRGLSYALAELADLTRYSPDPVAALQSITTIIERPANEVRSITRLFCSDVEDKPWYNDRTMW